MEVVAIDFETEYDADYSVADMGSINYALDPRFCAYCVSMACNDGRSFSGKPEDAPWHWLQGATVLAYNVLFEQACMLRLTRDGIVPKDLKPAEWQDVQDLCAYHCLSHRRSLAAAVKAGLGIEMSKDPRKKAKGVKAEEFWANPQLWEEICQYCLEDSYATLLLWLKYEAGWPQIEREVARITRQGAITGIFLDMPALRSARKTLQAKITECKDSMPWYPESKPMSTAAFRSTCEEFGLELPKSTAKTCSKFQAFVSENKIMFPWVTAISDLRKANRTEKVLATMERFSRNSVMHIGLKYAGAHTLRWSGDEMNLQNLNTQPVFGINLRNVLHARPGHTLIVLDYSQIEPRTLFWMVGDEEFLDIVRGGTSVYEAYARINLGWEGGDLSDEDPKLYKMTKAIVLGLGYGMGANRFYETLPSSLQEEYSPGDVKMIVKQYRKQNRKIVNYWHQLERNLRDLSGSHEVQVMLPSGRPIRYYRIRVIPTLAPWGDMKDTVHVSYHKDDRKGTPIHPGLCCENVIQATARDIMAHRVVAIDEVLDIRPLFTSHDEVIYEVPEEEAQDWWDSIRAQLITPPSWAKGLPLGVSGYISPFYTKD
jgi:DNA polymerase I-like protein with 3'-5' exonuclease and polymerase domains